MLFDSPVAGQNFGARKPERVRASFRDGAILAASFMFAMMVLAHVAPEAMIRFFNKDAAVVAFGTDYLRIISYNFVAVGLVFSMSSMFQALGNTVPSFVSTSMRLLTFALPAWLLSMRPGFTIRQVWYASLVSVFLQMLLSFWLLRREMRKRMPAGAAAVPA